MFSFASEAVARWQGVEKNGVRSPAGCWAVFRRIERLAVGDPADGPADGIPLVLARNLTERGDDAISPDR